MTIILKNWVYDSALDASYHLGWVVDGVETNVDIIKDKKGTCFLYVKNKTTDCDERVRVFVDGGFWTHKKYNYLKKSKNWTEVTLYEPLTKLQNHWSRKTINILIDHRSLTNPHSNRNIKAVFECALRVKSTVLSNHPPTPELAHLLNKTKKKDHISLCLLHKVVKELYYKLIDLELDKETNEKYETLIWDFSKWYRYWGPGSKIIFKIEDPFSAEYLQNLVENNLLECFLKINALPGIKEFDEIKMALKAELTIKISDLFIEAFKKKTEGYDSKSKLDQLIKSKYEIFCDLNYYFSQLPNEDLNFVKDQIEGRWSEIIADMMLLQRNNANLNQ